MVVVYRNYYVSPITDKEYSSKEDLIKERVCLDIIDKYDPHNVTNKEYEDYIVCKEFLNNTDNIALHDVFIGCALFITISLLFVWLYRLLTIDDRDGLFK